MWKVNIPEVSQFSILLGLNLHQSQAKYILSKHKKAAHIKKDNHQIFRNGNYDKSNHQPLSKAMEDCWRQRQRQKQRLHRAKVGNQNDDIHSLQVKKQMVTFGGSTYYLLIYRVINKIYYPTPPSISTTNLAAQVDFLQQIFPLKSLKFCFLGYFGLQWM